MFQDNYNQENYFLPERRFHKIDSRSHFPDCPISIFNFLPDVYTKDDDVTVAFDAPEVTATEPTVKSMFC
jgi:hypothetical protein